MRSSIVLAAVLAAVMLFSSAPAWADDADLQPPAGEPPAGEQQAVADGPAYPAPPPETPQPRPPTFEAPPAAVVDEPVPVPAEISAVSVDAAARAVTAPCGGTVEAVCDPCCPPCGLWVRLEGLAALTDGPTGLLGPNTGVPTQMNWDDVEYDPEVAFGGRLTVGFWNSPRWRFLLRASVYGKWDGTSNQTGVVGATSTPGGPILISPTLSATLESEAVLWSGEFHAWRTLCDRRCLSLDVGLGARYTAFDEEVRGRFAVPFPGPGGPPSFKARVDNRYLMGQVGAMLSWKPGWRWNFYGSAKGLFGFADRNIRVEDTSIFVGGPHRSSLDDSEFGFGADAEIGVEFYLSRNWSLNLGYQFLYMDPVVRAQDALDLTQGATGSVQARAVDDNLLVHAVFLGVGWKQ